MVRRRDRTGERPIASMKSLIAPEFSRRYVRAMSTPPSLRALLFGLFAACFGALSLATARAAESDGVKVIQTNDRVSVLINGELFTRILVQDEAASGAVDGQERSDSHEPDQAHVFLSVDWPGRRSHESQLADVR